MISRFVSFVARKASPSSSPSSSLTPSAQRPAPLARMERFEGRALMHAAVTSVFADNRGEVQITFNEALDPKTVNTRSVFVHLPGADQAFGTADDQKITGRVKLTAGNRRIWYRPAEKVPFAAGSSYSIKVSGKLVEAADGDRIDGEFNGAGATSGNGTPGGDYLVLSKRNKTTQIARFSTLAGNMDVRLFTNQTPKNVANFLDYVNAGDYDNIFIQRNVPGFIWQTGGYNITPANAIGGVTARTPVENEPHITHNTRGTIALARPDLPNVPPSGDRGSNQFFFNVSDNSSGKPNDLDNQNGGFTAFGEVTSASGLAVMDALAAYPTVDASGGDPNSPFSDLAVQNSSVTVQQADQNPQGSLVTIRRIAVRNTIVAWV